MTTVKIGGIDVKFPFVPYDIQKEYMSKVIECLETKQNGILESPTGTGKTLSLLCASLAWLEHRKEQFDAQKTLLEQNCTDDVSPPKIIYASRTHSQLYQAMQEMRKTAYNYMRACVLGSREQLCINEEVVQEKNVSLKINICRTKVKKNQCFYCNRVEKQRSNQKLLDKSIIDIEDIVELGKMNNFCPYYMARELDRKADVVFMPYNYLLDPTISKSMGVQFKNNIIIFDEAHNIEKVCEESVSMQIKTTDIQAAIDDIEAVLQLLTSGANLDTDVINFTPEQLTTLEQMLIILKGQINEIKLVQLSLVGTVFDGDYIFDFLHKAGICDANGYGILDLLENILDFLATSKLQRNGYGLQLIKNLLSIVFYKIGPEFRQKIKESFKVQFDEEETSKFQNRSFTQFSQTQKGNCRILNFWCFCPGFGMNILMDRNIHCVILTSGTLAPLKPLISELELKIDVRIENPHIVKGDQVCVKILSSGPDKEPLISNYQNRSNPKYLQSLGMVISNLIRIIPDGILIFFPSYVIMQKSVEHWEENGTWDAINQIKPTYVEPKDKISFNSAMVDYYSKIKDPSYKGAIFMGVCRGKISEGLDFADINGRAVFITGLPYPPLKDPKVILKKQYLDFRYAKDKEYLKGDEWYNLGAIRAVNQAIGRVIRHKDDYGAIILLDSRFTNPRIKNNMSLWLRRHITDMKNFGEIIRDVRLFFQQAQKRAQSNGIKEIVIEQLVEVCASSSEDSLVKIHSDGRDSDESPPKKQR